jgi:outer membrane protein
MMCCLGYRTSASSSAQAFGRMLGLIGVLMCLSGAGSEESSPDEAPTVPAAGSDTFVIGVCDAILMGLERNSTVAIQRLEPQLFQTYVREQRAAFDPELSLTGERSEAKSQRRLGSQPDPFDLRDEQLEGELQISETLPTGTSLAVRAGMTGSVSNLYTDQYTGNVELTITQSLLQGFGTGANLASLRKARLDVDISRAELRGVAERVAADIEKGYWDLFLANREVEIQEESLDLALRQLSESLERVKVGRLPELELAAVEAEVAARRGSLIDAQSRNEQARLHLLHLLNPGKGPYWSTVPELVDRPFVPEDTLEAVETHEQLGLTYRPDLQQARFELEKEELDVGRTKNGLLPRLDVFIALGRTTYAESFEDAYPDLESPYYQATGGVSFTFPVPNRKSSAELARARISRDQQALAVENMERLVDLDIRSAYVEVLRTRQQIEATRVTRELQEKKLLAELEKFRVGKATNFLVLQAQRDLTGSRLNEAQAMVAYLSALVDLYVAEGTLLERRAITTFTE